MYKKKYDLIFFFVSNKNNDEIPYAYFIHIIYYIPTHNIVVAYVINYNIYKNLIFF